MEALAYQDIVQQYHRTVVLYKGEPVNVTAVGEDMPTKVRVLDLLQQKTRTVQFNLVDFTPPTFRIGMVNIGGSCLYVVRKPVRKMQVGVNSSNCNVSHIPEAKYLEGAGECMSQVSKFTGVEIGNAIKGIYPSFEECLDFIKNFRGTMAWDRQFAIDCRRQVFYRTALVGNLPRNCTKADKIQFAKGYEHLDILLGDNCDQTLQASRTK